MFQATFININHDYRVVILHIIIITKIWSCYFYGMTATNKCYPYPRYRGDSSQFKSCKGNDLTTWHTRARWAPRVVTVHNAVKETIRAHLTLVHVFHTYALMDTPWVAHALSHFTPVRYDRITFVSVAHEATQFVGPHKIPYARVQMNLLEFISLSRIWT
jgi:hypothetical protein